MIGKKINQLATELAPVSTDLTIIGDPISGVSKKITLAQLGAIFSGAVSFYTDLASFPATGDINVIYCAKDTKKLYLWSGSAYVEVFPSQALLDTYQLRSEKGVSNGYASLDSGGKVPISQLPSSIMEYKGTWNASTNTPTLANGTGDTGDVFICNVSGTVNFGAGPITFAVGDYVIYSGTIWQRSSGAVGTVTSVAVSRSGDALAITGSPVTTSGTINVGFAGNSTQYINGAGNLVTFPGVINEAQNLITEVYNKTGATLTKGTVVYINGGQGNLPTVTKALATGDSTSAQTYGIVRNDITNNNNGYVVAAGRISDLDTQAYTEGTQLYLSPTTAGTFTSTKPYAPQHLVYVGIVVRAHPTQGVIEVKIQNGYEMDELHNVAAQSPSNNDGLFWESSTSLWKNKSIATILGYTPQAQLNGTGFVKASGTSITYDNSTYVTTDTFQTISASKTFSVGLSLASAGGTNQITSFVNTNSIHSGSTATNVLGFNNSNNIYFGKGLNNGGVITFNNAAVRFYALPDADGTIALVGGSGVGTVTSVGLSSATSGVTIGSTPITTSGTITLAIATASGSQQGLLSSTDWTTFNNKQSALTNPVTGTGTTNYLPKFTGASTIGNSIVQDNGSALSIGGATVTDGTVLNVIGNQSSANIGLVLNNTNSTHARIYSIQNVNSNFVLYDYTANASRLTLTASGNLGLGVTPSAWSIGKAIELSSASIWALSTTDVNYLANTYFNGSFRYVNNHRALRYYQDSDSGIHAWYNAPSGTAGNAISFTQAMTLGSNSGLSIGTTTAASANGLLVAGVAIFNGKTNIVKSHSDYAFTVVNTDSNGYGMYLQAGSTNNAIDVFNAAGTTQLFKLTGTGAATFSSSVTAGGDISVSNAIRYKVSGTEYGVSFANAGAFGIEAYQGTYFYVGTGSGASASEKLRITNAGNVGIGTTNPSYLLDVNGAGRYVGSLTINEDGGGTKVLTIRSNWAGVDPAINVTTSNSLLLMTANTERMRITSGGNIGIGTSTISNTAGFSRQVQIEGTYPALTLKNVTGTAGSYSLGAGSNGDFGIWNNTTSSYPMYVNSSNAVTFLNTIQTGAPSGGTAKPWKLGQDTSTLYTATRTIQVEIDGSVYYLLAVKSSDL
jgi:hypothetical protein